MRISDWSSDVCSSDLVDTSALADMVHAHAGLFQFVDQERALAKIRQLGLPAVAVEPGEQMHHLALTAADFHFIDHHQQTLDVHRPDRRSEKSRVGNEGIGTLRTRWSPYKKKKK